MAKKIEIIGQALVITDTISGDVVFEAPKAEYYYKLKTLLNQNKIKFYNLDHEDNASARPITVDLTDAIDSTDTPFTVNSFQTFARENLGFKTASGSSGAYTLPDIDGINGQVLKTDGNGTVTWQNDNSGGSSNLPWINIEDYGAVADALGDSGVDSTTAWNDALDALETAGGGVLYIPYTNGKHFNITPETETTRDYSNIVITSFTQGRIFVKDTTTGSNTGRGVLLNIGTGTNNFRIENLDILVSSGAARNNYENAVICSQVGNWSNLKIKGCTIKNETKLDTALGVDGILFYSDDTDVLDQDPISNITIEDCVIELYGKSIYGILFDRTGQNAVVKNTTVELHAWDDNSNLAFNGIAFYGGFKDFYVNNCIVYSAGHSGFAASMGTNGVFDTCWAYNVTGLAEAGFEAEYKDDHAFSNTASNSIKFINCYADNCYWGLAVLERADGATTNAPFNVSFDNCTVTNSLINDCIIASSIIGSTDYTSQITDVTIKDCTFDSTASDAQLHIYDAKNVIVKNNRFKGGAAFGAKIGRNSTIYVTGSINFEGNEYYNHATDAIRIESTQADLSFINEKIYNPTSRGMFLFTCQGGTLQVYNSFVEGAGADGFYFSVGRTIQLGSIFSNNRAKDCGARGFLVRLDDSLLSGNVSKNCTTADNFETTGGTSVNNLDL